MVSRWTIYTISEKVIRFRQPDYDPDRAQKLFSSSMSRHPSTRNISSKSIHAFLSNLANRQTGKATQGKHIQTDKRRQSHLPPPLSEVNTERSPAVSCGLRSAGGGATLQQLHSDSHMSRIRLRRLSTSLLSLFRRSFVESRLTPARSTSTTVE